MLAIQKERISKKFLQKHLLHSPTRGYQKNLFLYYYQIGNRKGKLHE